MGQNCEEHPLAAQRHNRRTDSLQIWRAFWQLPNLNFTVASRMDGIVHEVSGHCQSETACSAGCLEIMSTNI